MFGAGIVGDTLIEPFLGLEGVKLTIRIVFRLAFVAFFVRPALTSPTSTDCYARKCTISCSKGYEFLPCLSGY